MALENKIGVKEISQNHDLKVRILRRFYQIEQSNIALCKRLHYSIIKLKRNASAFEANLFEASVFEADA